jgi:hypothetical protein
MRTLMAFAPRPNHRFTSWFRRVANRVFLTSAVARFKLFLEPQALRDAGAVDPRLPSLPVRVPNSNDRLLFLEWGYGG